MEFGRVCDIGKRDNNEDGILTLEMYADIGFFAVADGLGGHSYGELASKCVLDKAERNLIVGGEFECSGLALMSAGYTFPRLTGDYPAKQLDIIQIK